MPQMGSRAVSGAGCSGVLEGEWGCIPAKTEVFARFLHHAANRLPPGSPGSNHIGGGGGGGGFAGGVGGGAVGGATHAARSKNMYSRAFCCAVSVVGHAPGTSEDGC